MNTLNADDPRAWSKVISSHGNVLVLLVYSTFSTRRVHLSQGTQILVMHECLGPSSIKGADVLVTQGARASTTGTFTTLNRINSVPARSGFKSHCSTVGAG